MTLPVPLWRQPSSSESSGLPSLDETRRGVSPIDTVPSP